MLDVGDVTVTTGVGEMGTVTSAGDVTAASDLGDVAVTTGIGEVGAGTSAGDVTAVSDVDDVEITTGVGDVGTGTSGGGVTAMSGVHDVQYDGNMTRYVSGVGNVPRLPMRSSYAHYRLFSVVYLL